MTTTLFISPLPSFDGSVPRDIYDRFVQYQCQLIENHNGPAVLAAGVYTFPRTLRLQEGFHIVQLVDG